MSPATHPHPRPLLILDLDETLIHASERALGRPADFPVGPFRVYKRPHLDTFLAEMSQLYRLAIWSSAADDYVADIAARIEASPGAFEFVWARSRGTLRRDLERNEWYYAKDLAKLRRRGEDLRRVLIVDDSPRKVAKSYGNAVYVRPFLGNPADHELPLLAQYLASLHDRPNFRRIEKRGWRDKTRNSGNP